MPNRSSTLRGTIEIGRLNRGFAALRLNVFSGRDASDQARFRSGALDASSAAILMVGSRQSDRICQSRPGPEC